MKKLRRRVHVIEIMVLAMVFRLGGDAPDSSRHLPAACDHYARYAREGLA